MKNCKTSTHQISRKLSHIACVATVAMASTLALPQSARAQTVTPPPVPPGLEVLAPSEAFLLGRGVGTQNYECQPTGRLGRVGWVLFTPQATLFDDQGEQLTTHFFSPNPDESRIVRVTWQDSRDTSTVWAKMTASASVDPNAIAWLKLEVVNTQPGPTGGDTLTGTTFLQRLNTRGGLAPTTGCDVLSDVGHKAFVPYTADYFFYRH
jgi:hypothetical protein